jgi:MoxR-like ATPase
LQERVARITVSPNVRSYLVDLGRATRAHPQVTLGLSPRGLLMWQRVAQAWAFLRQRPFVTPDDVQQVAPPVLGVRLGTAADAATGVVKQIVESIPVPV